MPVVLKRDSQFEYLEWLSNVDGSSVSQHVLTRIEWCYILKLRYNLAMSKYHYFAHLEDHNIDLYNSNQDPYNDKYKYMLRALRCRTIAANYMARADRIQEELKDMENC